MTVPYNQNPKVTDTVLFTLTTTDANGLLINPYMVNSVIIYFLERSYQYNNTLVLPGDIDIPNNASFTDSYFTDAQTVVIFGDPDTYPAWLSTDTDNAFLTKQDFDSNGNPLVGTFQLQWNPQTNLAREGDYVICWTWTPIAAGESLSNYIHFYLHSDTTQTTVIPTHVTPPDKYTTLLELYLPEMFKILITAYDYTPDVLNRTNAAIAQGFTVLENLTNQIVDLQDANATSEFLLPYLSNLFYFKLKSSDVQLWRRQIKRAVPLFKKKGTKSALREGLLQAGMKLLKYTPLWQVISPSTWQDGFVVTEDDVLADPPTFQLSKVALIESPLDDENFAVYLRLKGSDTYTPLTLDYVNFYNTAGQPGCGAATVLASYVQWVGNNLSVAPISLHVGDVLLVRYKVAPVPDQTLENYIVSLPLADSRDILAVTCPLKNWNVRLIADDDPYLDLICPTRHPYHDFVVWGKVRTEFPYSENVWNSDTYNGSLRDSFDPCDMDCTFLDPCSCGLSSYYNVDIEISNISPDRMDEATDILSEMLPFHAVPSQIMFVGGQEDFVLPPIEEIETLMQVHQNDYVIATQFDFNRLIQDGSSDALELKRNMLANAVVAGTATGTGYNESVVLFSPPVQFSTLGVDSDIPTENLLEILSGPNSGNYNVQLRRGEKFVIDVIQGSPDSTPFPPDPGSFPFRLSNKMYTELGASVYQDDYVVFTDANQKFVDLGVMDGWTVNVPSGSQAGSYLVADVLPNNSLVLEGWSFGVGGNVSYQIRDPLAGTVATGTATIVVTRQGRLEIEQVTEELGIRASDYVLANGTQYQIDRIIRGESVDEVYLDGYADGDNVGMFNVVVLRRLLDNAVGFLDVRGMLLDGLIPTVDGTLEDNTFLSNYLILIGSIYYQIAFINGSTMKLLGPMQTWGLTGTSVSYSIIQFIKTSPITTEDGAEFYLLDRRGNDSITVTTETQVPLMMKAQVLNSINRKRNAVTETIGATEDIQIEVEYR